MLVACGRIDDGTTDAIADGGTGGLDAAGGRSSGSGAAQNGTGGDRETDPTDPETSTGGQTGTVYDPWGPCNREYVGLEPPCGESDVNGVLSTSCGLWFDVPLAHVTTPAMGLQVVLLPPTPGEEASAMGGMGGGPAQPLVLDVISVFADEPPRSYGETFDLAEPAGYVRAGGSNLGQLPGYVAETEEYGVAQVALLQGGEILSIHRGLYGLPPSDLCIK